MSTEIEKREDSKGKIITVYNLFGFSIALSVIPSVVAATGAIFAIMTVMIVAYIVRSGMPKDSMTYNHMTFIVRTIWLGSLYATVMLSIAAYYLLMTINNAPLDPCIQRFMNVGLDSYFQLSSMPAVFESCMASYVSVNLKTFVISGAIAAVPAYLYFLLRFARGYSRALDGAPLKKPLEWF